MSFTHFSDMDLNLLVALDALLEERSVTAAARRVGLTQSAMSRTLARLRTSLGDELFVRSGRGLAQTPRAEALRAPLRQALAQLEAVVTDTPSFDPAAARRTFTIATVDYGVAVLIPPLVRRLAAEAPHVDLVVHPQSDDVDQRLAEGSVDLLVSPRRPSPPGFVWTRLFADEQVCVVRRGHPSVGRTLSLEQYLDLGHVFVAPAGQATGVVDRELGRKRERRRVALRVPSFLVAPLVVAETDLIATLAGRVARALATRLNLRVLPPPVALPGVEVHMAWHERMRRDPGHAWLRRVVSTLEL